MKLNDIIFAIGIIIISSLLVFVVYDDLTSIPHKVDLYEDMKVNVSQEVNLSDNDTKLIPINISDNTTYIQLNSKTKTYTQSSSDATFTKTSNTRTNIIKDSNPQKNTASINVKIYSQDSKPSIYSNTPNNKQIRPNERSNIKNNNQHGAIKAPN